MPHPRLTILVLARDSAGYFERTLPNLRGVADELVIGIDSLSQDDSPEVARRFADRVIQFPHASILPDGDSASPGVDEFLLPHCAGDWILRVDHDETLGPEWRDGELLDSILSERRVTHAMVPRRWAAGNGECYLSGRHWHPDGNLRLFRNIPSLLRMPRVWHQDIRFAGERRYLAELYLVHWSNVWTSRAERATRARFYASRAAYSGHEFYLYEHQPYSLRPLHDPLPDPRFEVDHAAAADPRYGVGLRVFRKPETMLAGDVEPVLIGIYNGAERPLRPDSDLVWTGGFCLSYHWWSEPPGAEPVIFDGDRFPLPKSILPGEYALAWMRIRAPKQPRIYRAGLDLVEENVSWFGWHVEMPAFTVNVLPREDENTIFLVREGVVSGGQDRKTRSADEHLAQLVGQALPPANRSGSDQELAGESACPTFFMKFRGRNTHPDRVERPGSVQRPLPLVAAR